MKRKEESTVATIKLEHINKNFGDLHVLKDVNLEVKDGEKLPVAGSVGKQSEAMK